MDTHSDPRFEIDEDALTLEHFRDNFERVALGIEEIALHLETNPDDSQALRELQSHLKELYSYAVNTNIAPLIEPLMTLDDFIENLGTTYRVDITHPLTLLVDRLLLIANEAADYASISMQKIMEVQKAIQPMARLKDHGNIDLSISQVIDTLLGKYTEDTRGDDTIDLFDMDDGGIDLFDSSFDSVISEPESVENTPVTEPVEVIPPKVEASREVTENDLLILEASLFKKTSVYRLLAENIDNRHKLWVGRSFFLFSLALKLNAESGYKVDSEDLAIGIFLHDFPMVRLHDEVLYAQEMCRKTFKKIQEHVGHAKELASSMGCSENVINMVYQHHERPDGKGYPLGLTTDQICDGAKIIAICDAYYAMTNYKVNRKVKRSALRTVAEINACIGTQFDEYWVHVFNKVVKKYNMLPNM